MSSCDCASRVSEYADSVHTCSRCLPAGAITWLIENGRQLDLFEEEGVANAMMGLESIEKCAQDQVNAH